MGMFFQPCQMTRDVTERSPISSMILPMVDGEILNLRKIWCVEDLTINLNNHGWWLIFALNPTFLFRSFHVSYIFPMNFQCVLMRFPYFSHEFPWFPGFSHVLSHFFPRFSPYVRCFSSRPVLLVFSEVPWPSRPGKCPAGTAPPPRWRPDALEIRGILMGYGWEKRKSMGKYHGQKLGNGIWMRDMDGEIDVGYECLLGNS